MKGRTSLLLTIALFAFTVSCQPSDEKISDAVKTALAANPTLSTVNASVKEGVVTLTGEVETEEQKTLAESSAASVKGIKSVNNSLTVKPKGPTPEEIQRMANDSLVAKVNENFATYKVEGITATAVNGVVTLTGEITRKNLPNAIKAAMESGATRVDNQMTIKK